MTLSESLRFSLDLRNHPEFKPIPGMRYVLITETGRMHGCGRIESVDSNWGPMDNGAPIDDGWLPDLRDDVTFDIMLAFALRHSFGRDNE